MTGILEFLPELNRFNHYVPIPRPATPEFLEGVLADRQNRYLLTTEDAFTPSLVLWMSQHGFQTVFLEHGYRFIELPVSY